MRKNLIKNRFDGMSIKVKATTEPREGGSGHGDRETKNAARRDKKPGERTAASQDYQGQTSKERPLSRRTRGDLQLTGRHGRTHAVFSAPAPCTEETEGDFTEAAAIPRRNKSGEEEGEAAATRAVQEANRWAQAEGMQVSRNVGVGWGARKQGCQEQRTGGLVGGGEKGAPRSTGKRPLSPPPPDQRGPTSVSGLPTVRTAVRGGACWLHGGPTLRAGRAGDHSVQWLGRVQLFADPVDCNTPGFPAHHQLLELTQTHVH